MGAVTRDRTLALAGIFQAASLVHQLATTGSPDKAAFLASIHSLYMMDAQDVPSVYGGISGVEHGLQVLSGYGGQEKNAETLTILGYVFSLMHLSRKFIRDPGQVEHLGENLQAMQRQKEYFASLDGEVTTNSSILSRMADLYSETIGTLQPRIMVKGEANWLQQEDIVRRIRSLLLSGVRSTVLWNQLGGGRLQFLFRRKLYAASAESILAEI